MKVLCKRKSVFTLKAGKNFELAVGVNEIDKEQAENLIGRGLAFEYTEEEEGEILADKVSTSKTKK